MKKSSQTNNAPDSEKSDTYRPISRKYLRYLIEALNDEDSGAGVFAQLATRLIHRRKCANILPATEPSSSGDYGQDARTHTTLLDSDNRFRLYTSPPETAERWIFAYSINIKWKTKLQADAAKIISNNLQPDRIVFVTNQFISPERKKIDAEREVTKKHNVKCEILDGQWFLNQLYDYDYQLAVEILGCPPEQDPELMAMFRRVFGLKETGLAEEDALEVERLKKQVQYRNRYVDIPEHLIQDLRHIGEILSNYDEYIEESFQWFEAAIPELDKLAVPTDGLELLYSYFKALFKLPNGASKIFDLLPKLIDMVFVCDSRTTYHYASVWLHYLAPHMQGNPQFWALYDLTIQRFKSLDRSQMGSLGEAYLDEVILYLEFFPRNGTVFPQSEFVKSWKIYLQKLSRVPSFPMDRVANVFAGLAPFFKDEPDYEECFELALELESNQEGNFQRASTLKKRALAHEKVGQLYDAIIMATRAKVLWLSEDVIRGYLLITYALSSWYARLGFYQAAEFELMEGIFICNWSSEMQEPDIMATMILEMSKLALLQGRLLQSFRWVRFYYPVCKLYRIEPKAEVFEDYIQGNLYVALSRLYTKNRSVHDALKNFVDQWDKTIIQAYSEIVLSSDEDFEKFLSDLTEEQQNNLRQSRKQVHDGTLSPAEDLVDYNELAVQQYLEWQMPVPYQDILHIRIEYPRNLDLGVFAFTIATFLQVWSVFYQKKIHELSFTDDRVVLTLDWNRNKDTDDLSVTNQFHNGAYRIHIMANKNYLERISGRTNEGMIHLFIRAILEIFGNIVLDDHQDILDLIAPEQSQEFIDRFTTVGSPSHLIKNTHIVSEVIGGDYAS